MRALLPLLAGAALLLAGCGGGGGSATTAARTPTAATTKRIVTVPVPTATQAPVTAAAPPTLTSLADLATCNILQRNIAYVSGVVSQSVDYITNSLHPKELAERTGIGRKNLLYAADLLERTKAPKSLVHAKGQLTQGLRRFAADFRNAQVAVAHKNMAKAAFDLVDRQAVAKIKASTQAINRACGA
jgi:hypothetical protein